MVPSAMPAVPALANVRFVPAQSIYKNNRRPPLLQAEKGATMASLLEFKNVTKVYSRGVLSKTSTTALNNVSLNLDQDEPTIMTIAGESGSELNLSIQVSHSFPELWIRGAKGPVRIEYAPSLNRLTNWSFLTTVQAVSNPFLFNDPTAVSAP